MGLQKITKILQNYLSDRNRQFVQIHNAKSFEAV